MTHATILIGTVQGQSILFQQRLPFYDGAQVVVDIHPLQSSAMPPQIPKRRAALPKHQCGKVMSSLRREEFYTDAR